MSGYHKYINNTVRTIVVAVAAVVVLRVSFCQKYSFTTCQDVKYSRRKEGKKLRGNMIH